MFQRVNYGEITKEENRTLPDLQPREWLVIVPIAAMVFVMGVVPNLFLRPMESSVERMLNLMQRNVSLRADASGQAASGLSTLTEDQFAERGARVARRDDREYREYLREEQRSQPGCPAREVVLDQRGQATSSSSSAFRRWHP